MYESWDYGIESPQRDGVESMRIFRWFMGMFFGVCVLALLVVQLVLTTPRAREAMAGRMGGVGVAGETVGVLLGELVLSLEGVNPSSGIRILQNGVPITVFNQQVVTVMVEDNSLIEIDGMDIRDSFRVRVDSYSENMRLVEGVQEIEVDGGIVVLDRVLVK